MAITLTIDVAASFRLLVRAVWLTAVGSTAGATGVVTETDEASAAGRIDETVTDALARLAGATEVATLGNVSIFCRGGAVVVLTTGAVVTVVTDDAK